MARQKIILGTIICLLITAFVGQTLSQTPISNPQRDRAYYERLRKMTPAQRQRELNRQIQIKIQQRLKEQEKEPEQNQEQRRIELKRRQEEAIKQALGATDEQWEIIKPRLEKVQNLTEISISLLSYGTASGSASMSNTSKSGAGAYVGGGSVGTNTRTAPSKPNNKETYSVKYGWKWHKPSDRKAPGELTKGEKLSEEILELIEDKNSQQEEIEQKMETLRKIRQESKKQLTKARQELCEVLTFRQEATLIMMGRLY